MADEQTQPGAPDATPPAGVDPATAPADPAAATVTTNAPGAIVTSAVSSPSTVPAGTEHEAAPALDPGQEPSKASPSSVMPGDDGYVSSRPLLMIGAAGDEVAELGYLLAAHGYENAISQGQAAAPPILDDALMRVVVQFQQANGIDPWAADGPAAPVLTSREHYGVVDAATWSALLGYQPKAAAVGSEIAEGIGGPTS